jgi:hypothetical protein
MLMLQSSVLTLEPFVLIAEFGNGGNGLIAAGFRVLM